MLPIQVFTTKQVFCYEAYAFVSNNYEDWNRTIIHSEYSIKFRPLLFSKRVQIKLRSCKVLRRFEVEDLILKSRPEGKVLYMGSLAIQAVRRFTKHPREIGLWRFWQMEYTENDLSQEKYALSEAPDTIEYASTIETNILIGVYDKSLFKTESEPPLPRAWSFKKSTIAQILEYLKLEKKRNLPYSCHESTIGDWSEYCGLSVNMDSTSTLWDSKSHADILESGPNPKQRKLQNTHFNASIDSIGSWEETRKYYATIDSKLYRSPWETMTMLEDMGYRVTRIYPQTQKQYIEKLKSISNPKLTATLLREIEDLEHLIDFSAKIPK